MPMGWQDKTAEAHNQIAKTMKKKIQELCHRIAKWQAQIKRIRKYTRTTRFGSTWYYAEVEVLVGWWWVTLCTIRDTNAWYPGTRAEEIMDMLEDDL